MRLLSDKNTMKNKILIIFIGILLFSCARVDQDVSLRGGGSRVKVSKNLPPAYCEELGEVYASHQHRSRHMEKIVRNVHNSLRNKAFRLGGNFVTVNSSHSGAHWGNTTLAVSGTSYACRTADNRFKKLRKRGLEVVGPNKRQWRFFSKDVSEEDINDALKDLQYNKSGRNIVDRAAQEELINRRPAARTNY